MRTNFLLPYQCKYPGVILIVAGIVFSGLYLWTNFQISMPMPALISSYLETRYFTLVRTNIADEILMFSLISGFALVVFSEERNEKNRYMSYRLKSVFQAFKINTILMLFLVLFIYGNGFMIVLVLNLVSVFILYLFFFYSMVQRSP